MALDPYSLCLCGSGKKLKFCCADLAHELEKVQRMIEGEQFNACLAHLRSLVAKHPTRASLLSLLSMMELRLELYDDARRTSARMIELFPDNPVALCRWAICEGRDGRAREAIAALEKAIAQSGDAILTPILSAATSIALALFQQGEFFAARQQLLLAISLGGSEAEIAWRLFREIEGNPHVPLCLKDDWLVLDPPTGVSWADEFTQARDAVGSGQWTQAADRFQALAARENAPAAWRAAGLCRASAADNAAAVTALRKFAALDVPLDDAVDAEELAFLLDPEARDDAVPYVRLEYPLYDVEMLLEAVGRDARFRPAPVAPESWPPEAGPPPQHSFVLCDRVPPESAEGLAAADLPFQRAELLVFGRESDRAPRLDVTTAQDEHYETVRKALRDLGFGILGDATGPEVFARIPVLKNTLMARVWIPKGATPPQAQALVEEVKRGALSDRWPQTKLRTLGGRTPADAARDGALPLRVLALVQHLELNGNLPADVDFNALRRQLALPEAGPVPAPTDDRVVPLCRMHRLETEALRDEQLGELISSAEMRDAEQALGHLAREVARRGRDVGEATLEDAYGHLARCEAEPAAARKYITLARTAAQAAGRSYAHWDLTDLELSLAVGDVPSFKELLARIQKLHLREEGVEERFVSILMRAGILRPDGTLAAGPPSEAVLADTAPETELWTPAGAGTGEGKKLWLPGDS